jgi:hypothetical protein
MYRYQIKKGFENREFTHSRRISANVVESDYELNSSYLEFIEEIDSQGNKVAQPEKTEMTATADPAPTQPVNPTPPAPAIPPQNEQTANKETN